jgi:hypothetical protein
VHRKPSNDNTVVLLTPSNGRGRTEAHLPIKTNTVSIPLPDSQQLVEKRERLPHSTCGRISLILAILSIAVFIGSSICIGMIMGDTLPDFDKPSDIKLEGSVALVSGITSFFSGGCAFASFTALILGIVGLFQPRTRKVFSILGIGCVNNLWYFGTMLG